MNIAEAFLDFSAATIKWGVGAVTRERNELLLDAIMQSATTVDVGDESAIEFQDGSVVYDETAFDTIDDAIEYAAQAAHEAESDGGSDIK